MTLRTGPPERFCYWSRLLLSIPSTIPVSIYDKYPFCPFIQPICTRYCVTMTKMSVYQGAERLEARGVEMQTLMIYKLGFNQNHYTFTLILLIKIVLSSKFIWTKFIIYKCFGMRVRTRAESTAFPKDCSDCVVRVDFPDLQRSKVDGIWEQLLRRNVKRFRGGLVFNADRLVHHSTLGSRVIKQRTKVWHQCRSFWPNRGESISAKSEKVIFVYSGILGNIRLWVSSSKSHLLSSRDLTQSLLTFSAPYMEVESMYM
jgi:hypothetical protein